MDPLIKDVIFVYKLVMRTGHLRHFKLLYMNIMYDLCLCPLLMKVGTKSRLDADSWWETIERKHNIECVVDMERGLS